jgi:hypothetical protein
MVTICGNNGRILVPCLLGRGYVPFSSLLSRGLLSKDQGPPVSANVYHRQLVVGSMAEVSTSIETRLDSLANLSACFTRWLQPEHNGTDTRRGRKRKETSQFAL